MGEQEGRKVGNEDGREQRAEKSSGLQGVRALVEAAMRRIEQASVVPAPLTFPCFFGF